MADAAEVEHTATAPAQGKDAPPHEGHPKGRARFSSRQVQVILAFAAVYSIWGSTYLAMKFTNETIPPFLMAAVRFLIAGCGLYLWLRLRGAPRPTREHWRAAAIMGGLLLVGGNAVLAFAEKTVPSGIGALIIALVPLWMALMLWLRPGGTRPHSRTFLGLALGLVGVGLLASQGAGQGSAFTLAGAAICVVASISWAAGSVYSRAAPVPSVPLVATAMEMICGGLMLSVVALVTGEATSLRVETVSFRSAASLGYLIIFGSLVGFSAYTWLLRNVAPAKAATYAYVNPAVAVLLGWQFGKETLTGMTILASAVIIGAVVLTTTSRTPAAPAAERVEDLAREAAAPESVLALLEESPHELPDQSPDPSPDQSGTFANPGTAR